MRNTTEYDTGIQVILKTSWRLRLETPLCIKSSAKSAFKPTGLGNKTRYTQMNFFWNQSKGGDSFVEVSDIKFGLTVNSGKLIPYYGISSSSIRGALRSWTLRHLASRSNWNLLNEASDSSEASARLEVALKEDTGLRMVADCFGVGVGEIGGGDAYLSHMGQIRILVSPLAGASSKPWIQGENWRLDDNDFGPDNAIRHISVCGPLDRFTHAAKVGGLHYFLEIQKF